MANPPTPYTWVNQEDFYAPDMQDRVEDVLQFLVNPPMIRLRKTTTQSIANNTFVAVSWDFVEIENTNMWDAAQPTRLKPSVPGWYVGSCGFSFNGNVTGHREMNVWKNGATDHSNDFNMIRVGGEGYANASWTTVSRGNIFIEPFNGTTDYVEMYVYQNSGGSLGIQFGSQDAQPDFTLKWMAKL